MPVSKGGNKVGGGAVLGEEALPNTCRFATKKDIKKVWVYELQRSMRTTTLP